MTTETTLDGLFPMPSVPPSNFILQSLPGPNHDTTIALREILKDNHERWHIFFNDRGFHNHIAHHELAIWALGAPTDAIKEGYKLHGDYQRPMPQAPEPITVQNFKDHLGDFSYYPAYLAFFTDYIREHGVAPAVEKFIFSKDYNTDSGGHHPDMLGRFLGGLFHPMIHVGYGFEFGLPGLVAEGLAMAAGHRDLASARIPSSFFDENKIFLDEVKEVAARLKSFVLAEDPTAQHSSKGVHAFTILARILNDPELTNIGDKDDLGMYTPIVTQHGATIAKHMQDWQVNVSDERDIKRKVEELSWTNSLIYAVGGLQPGRSFNADFFLMHMVTSTIFLSVYMAFLSPASQALFLRSYFFTSLTWWIARGRPAFDIPHFYRTTSAHPIPPGPLPTPHKDALLSGDPARAAEPNPWSAILLNAIVHPDSHFSKIQRAFAHHAALFGKREAGQEELRGTGLEGAEQLDGTIFVRAASVTEGKMGRVRNGEEPKEWDRDGFFSNA